LPDGPHPDLFVKARGSRLVLGVDPEIDRRDPATSQLAERGEQ
jgi:hypothetical protein